MNLEINNLEKKYGNQIILKDLTISINNCQSLVILGPSGGGKTTLLRILAGLEKPDHGQIILNQTEMIFEESFLFEWRKKVSIVFQSFNLFPHLSALNNVLLPLEKVHHIHHDEARQIALQYFKKYNLTEHIHKKPYQLSGGQKQRVAIVRSLAVNPRLLLLDEVTSALDKELKEEIQNTIIQLKSDKVDLILVTHEEQFAEKTGDQFLHLINGSLK